MSIEVSDFIEVVVPDLIEKAKSEYKGNKYKSTIPLSGVNGQMYYVSIFNDQLGSDSYCTPDCALDLFSHYDDPGEDDPAYAVRIGAHEQAEYEAEGIRKQLNYYGFTELENKVHVEEIDSDNGQWSLISPDLGETLDSLLTKWKRAGGDPQNCPMPLEMLNAFWVMISELQLDHGDIATTGNIVLLNGQYPILIDRTISAEYVDDIKKYPYTFNDVYDLMVFDLLKITQRLNIDVDDLHPYIQAAVLMGLRDPYQNYHHWYSSYKE